jgi:hypothetical protein
MTMAVRQAALSAFPSPQSETPRVHAFAAAPPPSDIPQDARWTASNLPQSGVRAEHQQSGQWREDAPAAMTGR